MHKICMYNHKYILHSNTNIVDLNLDFISKTSCTFRKSKLLNFLILFYFLKSENLYHIYIVERNIKRILNYFMIFLF